MQPIQSPLLNRRTPKPPILYLWEQAAGCLREALPLPCQLQCSLVVLYTDTAIEERLASTCQTVSADGRSVGCRGRGPSTSGWVVWGGHEVTLALVRHWFAFSEQCIFAHLSASSRIKLCPLNFVKKLKGTTSTRLQGACNFFHAGDVLQKKKDLIKNKKNDEDVQQ